MKSTNLITEVSAEELGVLVSGMSTRLRDHENLGVSSSHGGLTVVSNPVHDNSTDDFDDASGLKGHRMARYRIRVISDGYLYEIPADTSPTGPPKLAIFTTNVPATGLIFFQAGGGGSPEVVTGSIRQYTVAGNADGLGAGFGITATVTVPVTVSWQVKLTTGWTTMKVGSSGGGTEDGVGPYYRLGEFGSLSIAKNTGRGWVRSFDVNGTLQTLSASTDVSYVATGYDPAVSGSVTTKLRLLFESGGGDWYRQNFLQVRVAFDNSSTGGGVKYSSVLSIDFRDRNKSWFCNQASKTHTFDDQTWRIMGEIERGIFSRSKRLLAWYVHHGDELVRRMVEEGVPQSFFVDFTLREAELWKVSPALAEYDYVLAISNAVYRYWPDVPIFQKLESYWTQFKQESSGCQPH